MKYSTLPRSPFVPPQQIQHLFSIPHFSCYLIQVSFLVLQEQLLVCHVPHEAPAEWGWEYELNSFTQPSSSSSPCTVDSRSGPNRLMVTFRIIAPENRILPSLLRLNINAHKCPALIRAKSVYSPFIKSRCLTHLTLLSHCNCKHCKSSRTVATGCQSQ